MGSLERQQLTSQQSVSPWDGATPRATDRVVLPPTTISLGDAALKDSSSPAGAAAVAADPFPACRDQPDESQAPAEPGSPAAPDAESPAAARPAQEGGGEAGARAASREEAAEMPQDHEGAPAADASQASQAPRAAAAAAAAARGASGPAAPLDAENASAAVGSADHTDAAGAKANRVAPAIEASQSAGSPLSPLAAPEDADKPAPPAPADVASAASLSDDAASPSESGAGASMDADGDVAPAPTTQLPRDGGANGAVLWSQADGLPSEPGGHELAPFPVGPTPAAAGSSTTAAAAPMPAGRQAASGRASMDVDDAAPAAQDIKRPEPEAPGVDAPSSPPSRPRDDVAPKLAPSPQAASHSDSSGGVGGVPATPQLFSVRRERAQVPLLDASVGIERAADPVARWANGFAAAARSMRGHVCRWSASQAPPSQPLLSHDEPSDESAGRGSGGSASLPLVSQALDTDAPAFRPLTQHPGVPAPPPALSDSSDGAWAFAASEAQHSPAPTSLPGRGSPPSKRAREDAAPSDTRAPESPSPLKRASAQAETEDVDDPVIAASSDQSADHLVADSPVAAAPSADAEASHSPAPPASSQPPEAADGAENAVALSDESDSSAPSSPPPERAAAPAPPTKPRPPPPPPLPLELPFPLDGRSRLVHPVPREHAAFQAAMEFLVYTYYAANS